ncbi:MAG: DNA-3-methyladenine glycosylase I [Nitrospirota bacterium]|nr:DNA-3-methyladenine glycosylase I [Nitrospirota bacterium]
MAMKQKPGGDPVRCDWCLGTERMRLYHDTEWGVPLHDDTKLFEFLILDCAQAGLSWSTILNKRENYRRALDHWDAHKIAAYGEADSARLLADAGIVRNRLKVAATITNARAFLAVQAEFGSFDTYLWRFVDGTPVVGGWGQVAEIPASTPVSDALSRDLKRRGFKFVGTTIVYAFMQSVGLVNDHTTGCFRLRELTGG